MQTNKINNLINSSRYHKNIYYFQINKIIRLYFRINEHLHQNLKNHKMKKDKGTK